MTEEFQKPDEGKVRLALLPFDALEGAAAAMGHGADRFGRDNWKLCDDPERFTNALLRHLSALLQGEALDPDTGLPHEYHIAANALFLAHFASTK